MLDAVDLEIAGGESVALTGVNGAGKTTLLGCLASVLRPDGGEVRWFGHLAGRDVALHRRIGMVAHESGLYSHLTLRENLVFAAQMSGIDDPRRCADQWLETGRHLAPHADVLPTRLSRGMRQRLAVARALIHNPPLLLFDEPFTGLDAAGAEWLLTLLADLHDRGHTICFVTHEQEKIRPSGPARTGVARRQASTTSRRSQDERHPVRHARHDTEAIVTAQIWWMIQKDLVSEWRSRRAWPAMILLGIVVAVVFSVQMDLPSEYKRQMAASLLWVAIFLAADAESRSILRPGTRGRLLAGPAALSGLAIVGVSSQTGGEHRLAGGAAVRAHSVVRRAHRRAAAEPPLGHGLGGTAGKHRHCLGRHVA